MTSYHRIPRSEHLPPKHVGTLRHKERIPTPVRSNGLVDIPQLICDVRQTVDPEFVWPKKYVNAHHLYWPENDFLNHRRKGKRPESDRRKFRELHINQANLPLMFHNWLHQVTEPPRPPSADAMVYTIDSYQVAVSLFQNIHMSRQCVRTARQQQQTAEAIAAGEPAPYDFRMMDPCVFARIVDDSHEQIDLSREQMRHIPPEFQLVDPDLPIDRLARQVGRLVAPDGLIYTRAVTLQM